MPELNIAINASAATRGAKQVTRALDSIVQKGRGLLNSVFTPLNAAIGALGGGAAVVGLSKTADEFTVMANRLEYLTGSAYDASVAEEELYRISKLTGTSMADNADTFTKLALASEMTGLSTQDNLKVLGSLNALMLKTGTSGVQASAAMLQLSQALASGRLQGDEFRSMAENAPGVLTEMARAIGVSRGELREMSRRGEITSEVMAKAFMDIADSAKGSMEDDMPETVQQGWNAVVLAFKKAWDYINDETGIMGDFRAMLFRIAGWIEENTPAFAEWFQDMKIIMEQNWPFIEDIFIGLVNKLGEWLKALAGSGPTIANWFTMMMQYANTMWQNIKPIFDAMLWAWNQVTKIAAGLGAAGGALAGNIINGLSSNSEAVDVGDAFMEAYRGDPYAALNEQVSGSSGGTNVYINQQVSRSDVGAIIAEGDRQSYRGY